MKAPSERKLLKNAGQLDAVKLFPRLVSKGLGSADVPVEVEVAGTLLDSASARLFSRIRGSGGSLVSKRSSDLVNAAVGLYEMDAATHGLHNMKKHSSVRRILRLQNAVDGRTLEA